MKQLATDLELTDALIIQSIDSGLLLTDVSIGWRMVVLGQVLVAAVVFDRVVQK